jgi:trk system potassium uptake protein TrkA
VRVLVIGGGKVGSYLARRLAAAHHVVSVIEPREHIAMKVVGETGVIVFEGDGTDVELLKRADVHRSDWAFAVTGQDDANLVAAQLARTLGARNVLARLNDPANGPTFEALGIRTVAVTDLMVDVIERDVLIGDLGSSALAAHGRISITEFDVPDDFPTTRIAELGLPNASIVIAIERPEGVVIPHGATKVKAGDRVVAASFADGVGDVAKVFESGPRPS